MATSRRKLPARSPRCSPPAVRRAAAAQDRASSCRSQLDGDARSNFDYRNNSAVVRRDVTITQGDLASRPSARVATASTSRTASWTVQRRRCASSMPEASALASDKAVVTFRGQARSRARPSPARPRPSSSSARTSTTARGRANTIDYDLTRGTVSFTGDAWLSDGTDRDHRRELVYNIARSAAQSSRAGAGRVRITIQPRRSAADEAEAASRSHERAAGHRLAKSYRKRQVVSDLSLSKSRAARSSGCSARTAPARPRRST